MDKELSHKRNWFKGVSPIVMAERYVETMNSLFLSADKNATWLQLDPISAGKDFIPSITLL